MKDTKRLTECEIDEILLELDRSIDETGATVHETGCWAEEHGDYVDYADISHDLATASRHVGLANYGMRPAV